MAVNVVFYPDIHVNRRLRVREAEFAEDSGIILEDSVVRLRELNRKIPVHAVVLPGDVYNRKEVSGIEQRVFQLFVEQLKQTLPGIGVYYIEGNHDINHGFPLCGIIGLESLSPDGVEVSDGQGSVVLHGWNYGDYTWKSFPVPDDGSAHVCVLHTGFRHLLGYENSFQAELSDIPEGFDLTVSGHVHSRWSGRTAAGKQMVSVGGMHPCTLAETGEKSLTLATFESGKGPVVRFLKIPSRAVLREEVTSEEDLPELRTALSGLSPATFFTLDSKKRFLRPVCEITYDLDLMAKIADLMYRHHEEVFFIPNGFRNTRIADLYSDHRKGDAFMTLGSAVREYVDAEKHPRQAKLALFLAGASSAERIAEMNVLYEEFMNEGTEL